MEVTARRVENFEQTERAGDFFWVGLPGEQPGRMHFLCPCGCGVLAGVTVKPVTANGWDWNGDLEKPTVKPSIRIDRDHWHGYLTDGVFRSC